MIEQLVARVFFTRNAAHIAHWKTQSYSQHKALGKFYDSLVDMIDGIVEAYQGRFKLIAAIPPRPAEQPKDILGYIEKELAWIEENREAISEGFTAIENSIDSLLDLYATTIYKLRNLD